MIGTTINLIDQSQIPKIEEAATIDTSPIFLAACATAKGTEKMQIVGDDFFVQYGNPSFKKYGQESIQAADIIKAGGRLLFKRIVADDATLANLIISAKVALKQVQKTNEEGEPLYKTEGGEETTDAGSEPANTPIMINHALIRYEASSVESASDFDTVVEGATALLDEAGTPGKGEETSITWFTYPLYAIADNGRGSSSKRIRIYPEFNLSKKLDIMFYTLSVLENSAISESTRFSIETDAEYQGESIELGEVANSYLTQIQAKNFTDSFDAFKTKVAELSGYDEDSLEETAYLVGMTKKKVKLETIEVDIEKGIDFTIENGLGLSNGSDGKFKNGTQTTAAATEYSARLVEFFSGQFDDDIFNQDVYRFVACIDANYPDPVKKEIENLANIRKDFMFYRDLGLNINSLYDVQTAVEKVQRSIYNSVWCTVYDLKDTYSKKQITVTMLYEMAPLLVNHFINNPDKIFAGFRYDAILSRAIRDTVKFYPKILPTEDQKSVMEDLKVNYAYYYDDSLVVESGWTSQKEYTQLSFVNNMNAIITVLNSLRAFFPRVRYQNISTSNTSLIDDYTLGINNHISQFSNMFEELRFEYVEDNIAVANKLYKGAIYFRFADFEQGEIIDAYALPTNIDVNVGA